MSMIVTMLSSECVATDIVDRLLRTALVRNVESTGPQAMGSLPTLPLVPKWSQLLRLPGAWAPDAPDWQAWRSPSLRPAVPRLGVRELYARFAQRPRLDRVGRFAHIDFPRSGLSTGAELLWLAPEPPREDYPTIQQVTPAWSLWYKPRSNPWAVGVATGSRFLIEQQANTVIDPFTSEARWALFLP